MKYLIEVVEEKFVTVAFAEPSVTIGTEVVDTSEMQVELFYEDFDNGATTGELLEYGIFRVQVLIDEVLWNRVNGDEVLEQGGSY